MILGTLRAVLGAVLGLGGPPTAGAPLLVEIATVRSLNPVRTVSGDLAYTVSSSSLRRTVEGIP